MVLARQLGPDDWKFILCITGWQYIMKSLHTQGVSSPERSVFCRLGVYFHFRSLLRFPTGCVTLSDTGWGWDISVNQKMHSEWGFWTKRWKDPTMVFNIMPGRDGIIARAIGRHTASIGCECPHSDCLHKYHKSYGPGGALKVKTFTSSLHSSLEKWLSDKGALVTEGLIGHDVKWTVSLSS